MTTIYPEVMMQEDRLDIEDPTQLIAYLESAGHIQADERPQVTTLPGGVSNRTVLLKRAAGEEWVLKQALAKLRVEADWFSDPTRIHREAAGLRWLGRHAPPGAVPELLFEDHRHHLLAMRAVPQPHRNWKELLLAGRVVPEQVRRFGLLLGVIHRRGYQRREETARLFADRTFFETLRLEPYYHYTATRVPTAAEFLAALVDETRACRLTLVHGDYSPKNILLHQGELVLLDHEVIHFGDPAFDLGFALTHLLSKALHLPSKKQDFLTAALIFWRAYLESLAAVPWLGELEARALRHTLACMLARAQGRSPLEYLSAEARARQRDRVLALLAAPPATLNELLRLLGAEENAYH